MMEKEIRERLTWGCKGHKIETTDGTDYDCDYEDPPECERCIFGPQDEYGHPRGNVDPRFGLADIPDLVLALDAEREQCNELADCVDFLQITTDELGRQRDSWISRAEQLRKVEEERKQAKEAGLELAAIAKEFDRRNEATKTDRDALAAQVARLRGALESIKRGTRLEGALDVLSTPAPAAGRGTK
jgi:hypothetical protein